MPVTKNFSLRIEILDQLLSIGKKFTFGQLLERINEKLSEMGLSEISDRTLRNDIKFLRDEKDAPLFKATNAEPFYYYVNKFSIKELILSDEDVDYFKQAADILKKVAGLSFGAELDEIIKKLENRVHTNIPERSNFIQFENQVITLGLNWIDDIFNSIKNKSVIRISYLPFHFEITKDFIFHPYLLKQYRNRWFVFGRTDENDYLTIFALDRIKGIKNSKNIYIENNLFDPEKYFNNLVGVSVKKDSKIEEILIKVKGPQLQYILSKPIHNNQEMQKKYKNGDAMIKLNLYINYELISQLMGYGSTIEVIEPKFLRDEIKLDILSLSKIYSN
jgi:predicted DNA-binding transcriptional regulator YafY